MHLPPFFDIDFALVCYEKPSDFCHRHLVADWLNKNGYDCEELSDEAYHEFKKYVVDDSISYIG